MAEQRPKFRPPYVGGVLLLLIRGLLLWLVIPIGVLWWLGTWPRWRRRSVGIGQLLGWIDLNLIAAIERTVLRPLVRQPRGWTPLAALSATVHRIRVIDPW